jgi:hypothetical protein
MRFTGKMKQAAVVLVLTGLAAGGAACSSGAASSPPPSTHPSTTATTSAPTTTTTATLSDADAVTQLNAARDAANIPLAQATAAGNALTASATAQDWANVLKPIVAADQVFQSTIEAIKWPEHAKTAAQAFISASANDLAIYQSVGTQTNYSFSAWDVQRNQAEAAYGVALNALLVELGAPTITLPTS